MGLGEAVQQQQRRLAAVAAEARSDFRAVQQQSGVPQSP
jgi:hypothetical protein